MCDVAVGMLFIDCRPAEEYRATHIDYPHSMNIPDEVIREGWFIHAMRCCIAETLNLSLLFICIFQIVGGSSVSIFVDRFNTVMANAYGEKICGSNWSSFQRGEPSTKVKNWHLAGNSSSGNLTMQHFIWINSVTSFEFHYFSGIKITISRTIVVYCCLMVATKTLPCCIRCMWPIRHGKDPKARVWASILMTFSTAMNTNLSIK